MGRQEQPAADIGLIQLWPQPDTAIKTSLDIIAVHGLGGHPIKTWRSGEKVWLRDFLPSAVPEARVLTYGYASKATLAKTVLDIEDFARDLLERILGARRQYPNPRPIIFICHSLGGIVFKRSLCLAHEREARYGQLLSQVKSVIFMGTPHRGSNLAYWGKLLGSLSNVFVFNSVRTDLLEDLQPKSQLLGTICDQFVERSVQLRIFTLYEKVKMQKLKALVVDEDSAILHLPNETPLPMQADHRDMCKFLTPNDPGFLLLLSCLTDAVDSLKSSPQKTASVSQAKFVRDLSPNTGDFSPATKYQATPDPEPRTCDWIQVDHRFADWFKGHKASWLWIHGSAGSGKSVLTKHIIELLQRRSDENSGMESSAPADVISVMFCDAKITSRSNASLLLRSILSQILASQPSLIKHLEGKIDAEDIDRLTPQDLKGYLSEVTLWATSTRFWVVVDVMDELPDTASAQLLEALKEVCLHDSSRRIHVLFSDRAGVAPNYSHMTTSLSLDSEVMHKTVQQYIDRKISQFQIKNSIPQKFVQQIQAGITSRSSTNFLVASLSWSAFSEGVSIWTPATIKRKLRALDEIQVDFGHLYVNLLSNVPEDFRPALKKIFMLCTVARRPLSVDDLHFAVSIQDDHQSFEDVEEELSFNFDKILEQHGSPFLSIDASNFVQFRHHSFREFLTQKTRDPDHEDLVRQFRSSITGCEYFANWLCQKVLRFQDWRAWKGRLLQPSVTDKSMNGLKHNMSINSPNFPLLLYSVQHFGSHLEQVQDEPEIIETTCLLFTKQNTLTFWELYERLGKEMLGYNLKLTPELMIDCPPAHLLIQLGDFVEILKKLKQDPNQLDSRGLSPLSWAVQKKRNKVAAFLLFSPAVNPNAGLAIADKPIHISAGDEKMFKLLVASKKIDINSRGLRGRTPLHVLISRGPSFQPLLSRLLEREDLNLNVLDKDGTTPFIFALSRGDGEWAAVELLSCPRERLDISTTDSNGTNALALASLQGWPKVRRILFSRDRSQMFSLGEDGMNMLTRAAYFGHRNELMGLLESVPREDIVRLSNQGRFNLMNLCAQQDWGDLVEHLRVNFDLESREQDTRGRTILHWAAFSGWSYAETQLSRTQQLLTNIQDFDGCTPLHLAAEHRNLPAVEQLLRQGGNLLIRNKHGKTPVHVAAESGSRAVLELMLRQPMREFGRDKSGATLLHYVATWEWQPVLTDFIKSK